MAFAPLNTRRWQRHLVDLLVRVLPRSGVAQTAVTGRGSEISEGGMALYVGINLEPGDLVEVEFETPHCVRVAGIVRSKVGYCFGLEFLSPLLAGDRPADSSPESSSNDKLPIQMEEVHRVRDEELNGPLPRANIEVSNQTSGAPAFAPVEKASPGEIKLDRILHNAAARALQATGATGVAIGLGRKDAMICQATAGLPFPGFGLRINTESGLTAAAIHRQMSQWCSDTESDSRVDLEVCRQLGVRSIIVVPVCARDTVVGVFGLFSANPDAFSRSDLNTVKELTQGVSEAIENTGGHRPPDTTDPAIVQRDRLGGGQPVDAKSEFTLGAGLRNYGIRIRPAIVLALAMLAMMLSLHWGCHLTR